MTKTLTLRPRHRTKLKVKANTETHMPKVETKPTTEMETKSMHVTNARTRT